MPLYEYQCRKCDRRTEVMQRFDDPPLATCSECGGELKKLISAPAFQFKGSGWYVTDYTERGKSEGGAKESEGAKPEKETKSDAKGAKSESAGDASSSGSKKEGKAAKAT